MIWCAEHDAPIWFNETQLCSFAKYGPGYDPSPCRMTEALLIVKENGEWPEKVLRAIPMTDVDNGPLDGFFRRRANRILDALASVGDSP